MDDALVAGEWLARWSDIPVSAIVASRMGAVPAIAVASRLEVPTLVLWEPIINAEEYFSEAWRVRIMTDLREGKSTEDSRAILFRELEDQGMVDILGYSIDRPLYRSALNRRIDEDLVRYPHSVLLVQISRGRGLKGDYARLIARRRHQGFETGVHQLKGEIAWWLSAYEKSDAALTSELHEVTVDWILGSIDERLP